MTDEREPTRIEIIRDPNCPPEMAYLVPPGTYDLVPQHPVTVEGEVVAWAVSEQWAAELAGALDEVLGTPDLGDHSE